MQEAISKTASCKVPSSSENQKTMRSPMAKEMFSILSEIFKNSQPEDAPLTGRRTHDVLREEQKEAELDTAAITSKIIVAVLDLMDGSRVGRDDLKISDLLICDAEKIKHMTSNSEDSLNKRTLLVENKLSAQELQATATRAVSQVLLSSTGVLEMKSSSSELPSSVTSVADLDSMLEGMAQSGIPTDLMRNHLETTSREDRKSVV